MTKNLLVNSVLSNMDMMKHLLNQPRILDRDIPVKCSWGNDYYYKTNPENVELRQRIRLLRKDLVKLEKAIMSSERNWGLSDETNINE